MPSEHKTEIDIRYAETDKMGMVHHSAYVVYLEQARVEHLKAIGLPYHKLEERGVFLPVIELKIDYLKPARFGQKINVVSKIFPVKGARLKVEYSLFCGDELILTGYSIHAFIGENKRPIRPARDIIKAINYA